MTRKAIPPADPRHDPAYTVAEAASYLLLPEATLRSWVQGRTYPASGGSRRSRPLIEPAFRDRHGRGGMLLSFVNLIEAYVLAAIRRRYGIDMGKVRKAISYLRKRYDSKHPLAEKRLETDGIQIFVEDEERLISASEGGQLTIGAVLEEYLERIERDPRGLPVKLYPFTRHARDEEPLFRSPRLIEINPRVARGRPVIAGTGVPVEVLAERFEAGESIADLAHDYGRKTSEIEEALRCA